jgi:very-short-patch-repair endonuclease
LAEHATAEPGSGGPSFDPGKDHDSDFEISICKTLRDRGWEIHPQVGCAGFAIDLAVVDPRAAGKYLLGIECDGATYQSSATARDRDRLRHSVLTDLGWNLHRIWSSDWMHRPQTTLDALLKRLEELKSESPKEAKSVSGAAAPHAEPAESAESAEPPNPQIHSDELPPGIISYEHCRDGKILGTQQEMVELTAPKLARVVKRVVETEGPIHTEEALHACSEKFAAKASARPREAFERAVAYLVTNGTIIRKGDFLWPANLAEVPVRHRGGDCPVTNAEMICPEEIDALVKLLLKQQFGLPFDAIAEAAARAIGFARSGAKFKSAIDQSLVRLDGAGEIQLDNARFVTLRAGGNDPSLTQIQPNS